MRNLVRNDVQNADDNRDDLTAFLSSDSKSGGASDAIINIIKKMGDTMTATLAEITATEDSAKATFDSLVKARTDEVNALTEQIETDTKRIGDLGAEIVAMRENNRT